ncbi:hypothetical protein QLQ12_27070 [Actinoplanes sp. NEAU-A12]|uniref:Polymerase nucleotidyl transferase domain-containing protein n=1 Tax=Actinoplanes sandaracinus TaxID=3045177 RepID=A0ABT6WRC5_9ACTN|nr:hypothetical protein [Actinoplanes sandaracinus]MDI6102285.1 hypothetical protein [Actinoplanes sandaracinus]
MDVTPLLNTLRDRRMLPDPCIAVLLVGSAARGWSNSGSDLDIYLISDRPWPGADSAAIALPLDPPQVRSESFYLDGRRWELTYWQDRQVDQMLTKISWPEFDRDVAAGTVLVLREEAFLERLASGVPLLGEQWLTGRRAELDASAFRSLLITRSLGAADDAVEDALGQLAGGDLHSAVISARIAFGHAVDALLEERGQYGSYAPKWRARRFLAANPQALSFEEYWDMETMRGLDPAAPEKWIRKVLTRCQDISLKVEI